MKDNSRGEKIFELVKSSLIEHEGIDDMTIAQKLVRIGANEDLVMQDHKNGHVTKENIFLHLLLLAFIAWPT